LVTKLEGGEAEYIAALDADMIPEADLPRAIMAHIVKDPKMALVCPLQVSVSKYLTYLPALILSALLQRPRK
jgi:hypothetical protein